MEHKKSNTDIKDIVLNSPETLENLVQFGTPVEQLLARTAFEYAKEVQE